MLETLPLHHLTRVVSLLARGQIVAYPTGTSYGLGVNALDTNALERLSALKQRLEEKTYTVLLPGKDPERFVAWTAEEQQVVRALFNRPLTLLVKAGEPLLHIAEDGLVGIRTLDHPFTRQLAELTTFPVTATSANVSGKPPARTPEDIAQMTGTLRVYCVEGGTLPEHLPSTIAVRRGTRWNLVRKGDVTAQELTAVQRK